MRNGAIEHFEARAVFRGLLDGEGFRDRVAGVCVYRCPRCNRGIRFRWRSFYHAHDNSAFKRRLRRAFDELTPRLPTEEQGCFDFHCAGCAAPTRIVFSAEARDQLTYHFEIYAALVGAGTGTA